MVNNTEKREKALAEYKKTEEKRLEINLDHMASGVRFIDLKNAYIDETVSIGEGTVIYPGVILEGDTAIGKNCIVGSNTRIVDSVIGNDTDIWNSVILQSTVGCQTHIGPFAYLRPNSHIGDECKVGDFVEVKNSSMDDGAKASHLTYIGDSDVGKKVNLGCGVVFVNFDGSAKYRSRVSDGAFIGCNSNLISPVEIGEKAYVAAGSTITDNVPDGALYIERSDSRTVDGWVERRGILNRKK